MTWWFRKQLPHIYKLHRATIVVLENLASPFFPKWIERRRWRRELDRRFHALRLYVENWDLGQLFLHGTGEEECLGIIYAEGAVIAPAIIGGAPTTMPEIEQDVTNTKEFKRLERELWDHLAKIE